MLLPHTTCSSAGLGCKLLRALTIFVSLSQKFCKRHQRDFNKTNWQFTDTVAFGINLKTVCFSLDGAPLLSPVDQTFKREHMLQITDFNQFLFFLLKDFSEICTRASHNIDFTTRNLTALTIAKFLA